MVSEMIAAALIATPRMSRFAIARVIVRMNPAGKHQSDGNELRDPLSRHRDGKGKPEPTQQQERSNYCGCSYRNPGESVVSRRRPVGLHLILQSQVCELTDSA